MPLLKPPEAAIIQRRYYLRIEESLAQTMERYAEFLGTDNFDHVVSQALQFIFKRDSQFKSWLMRIAQRAFLAYRRSPNAQSADMTVSSDALASDIPPDRAEEDQLEMVMQSQELKTLVEQLPDPYKTTLVLRFYNDLPLADVAKRQNINLPLVKYRVRHGLKLLREKLSAQGVTEADI